MRILLLTTHVEIGGISSYVTTLARGLVQRGHHVHVASSGGTLEGEIIRAGALHWRVDLRTKSELHPKVWRAATEVQGWLRQTPVDVIHAQTRVAQVVAALVSRSGRVPYVTTCHGFYRRRWGRRWFPCWGERTIAISRPVETHLRQDFGLPQDRVRLVPTGIDVERVKQAIHPEEQAAWRRRLEEAPGDRFVATMSRLVAMKGVDLFLRALAEASRSVNGLRGIVIGDGEERPRLEKLAQELGLERRVAFVGTLPDPASLLSLCRIFVFPVMGLEGLGLSALEAMALGLPVVATKVGGLTDAVEHGYSGFLVPPGDATAMAKRLRQLIDDPELAKRMGVAAHAAVKDRFSLERMLEQVAEIYREVTCEP